MERRTQRKWVRPSFDGSRVKPELRNRAAVRLRCKLFERGCPPRRSPSPGRASPFGALSRLPTDASGDFGSASSDFNSALRVRPNLLGGLDEPGDLDPLIRFGQIVAVRGGGKAALVAERALLQRDVMRGLVDTAFDLVLVFRRRALGAHQPE